MVRVNDDLVMTRDEGEQDAGKVVMVVNDAGVPEPALITMKSTQLKKSRKWNSMMMSAKMIGKNGPYTPPMFSQLYRLTTQAESNDKGKWFGWEVERIGAIENADLYVAAKAFSSSISAGEVKVKHASDDAMEGGGATPF